MLATQGVKPPSGAVPTATEAQIEAAQIAGKANVRTSVKTERVLTGMAPPVVAPAPSTPPGMPGRFMSLRQGPGAARNFTAPSPEGVAANTVEGLRATTKFAPGPVGNPILQKVVPAVARTQAAKAAAETQDPVANTAAPKAVEAYTYGLRAASQNKAGQVPDWFGGAMKNGLDKYDALIKEKKP